MRWENMELCGYRKSPRNLKGMIGGFRGVILRSPLASSKSWMTILLSIEPSMVTVIPHDFRNLQMACWCGKKHQGLHPGVTIFSISLRHTMLESANWENQLLTQHYVTSPSGLVCQKWGNILPSNNGRHLRKWWQYLDNASFLTWNTPQTKPWFSSMSIHFRIPYRLFLIYDVWTYKRRMAVKTMGGYSSQ